MKKGYDTGPKKRVRHKPEYTINLDFESDSIYN